MISSLKKLNFVFLGSNTDFPLYGQSHIPQNPKLFHGIPPRGIRFLGTSEFYFYRFKLMTIKKKGENLKFSHISDLVEETKYGVVDTSLTQNIVVK